MDQYAYRWETDNREKARLRAHKWYDDNKERHKKDSARRSKEWTIWAREFAPKELMLRRTKNSALTRKIKCTITINDFEIPEHCPILGIKLVLNVGRPRDNSPSMDRIDNDKGYVPGNVCVISKEANRMKSDLTLEVLDKLRDYVLNPQKYIKILGN